MDSILTSIKQLFGIEDSFTNFDQELIMFINGAFTIVSQLGIGKPDFSITGSTETWMDFLNDSKVYELVKPDIYFRVKLAFDPPTSSSVIDAINKLISEYEWRLRENAEEATVESEMAALNSVSTSSSDDE